MKTITLLLIMLSVNVFSQARINVKPPDFTAVSQPLTQATGWAFNKENGTWYANDNTIADRENATGSSSETNFSQINIASYTYDNKKFFILLVQSTYGTFKYPSIHQGYYTVKKTSFTILDNTEFENLKTHLQKMNGANLVIENKLTGQFDDKYQSLGGEHKYNVRNLLSNILNKLEEKHSPKFYIRVNSQSTKDGDVVRFTLPKLDIVYELSSGNEYFEVPYAEFLKLFDLSENNSFQLL